jgi:galactose mutarotase-like enzyme
MFYTHERNFGCRLNDELTYRGLRVLVLENELLRVSLLLDQGTDIFEFLHKPSDTDFMWRSPLGVRQPGAFAPSSYLPGGAFMEYYEGGWQELFPQGGGLCQYQGSELGQHGEVWGLPWKHTVLEDTPEVISVKTWVRTVRTPFLLEKTLTMRRGAAVLEIEETATNEGRVPMDLMWGHHPAFGPPFLDESCRVYAAAARVYADENRGDRSRWEPGTYFPWPVGPGVKGEPVDASLITPPEQGVSDMLFLTDLREGWYGITNHRREVGFGMSWDLATFPHIWYWLSLGGTQGWPSFGREYVAALEPFSSYPGTLTEVIKWGNQMVMQPGEVRSTWLRAVAYEGGEVRGIDREGKVAW